MVLINMLEDNLRGREVEREDNFCVIFKIWRNKVDVKVWIIKIGNFLIIWKRIKIKVILLRIFVLIWINFLSK